MPQPNQVNALTLTTPGAGQSRVAEPLDGEEAGVQETNTANDTSAPNTTGDDQADEATQLAAALKMVADLRKEAASWRTKLRKFEEAERAREAADEEARLQKLDEVERLKEQLAKERETRSQLEASLRTTMVTNQIVEIATRLGFVDPSDAVVFIGADKAEVDEHGKVVGVEEALVKLLEQKPHLKKPAAAAAPTTPTQTASPLRATNPATSPTKTPEEELKRRVFGRPETTLFEGGGVFWKG